MRSLGGLDRYKIAARRSGALGKKKVYPKKDVRNAFTVHVI